MSEYKHLLREIYNNKVRILHMLPKETPITANGLDFLIGSNAFPLGTDYNLAKKIARQNVLEKYNFATS